MADEITCRRCSVIRVNTLCRLYDEGFNYKDERSKGQLHALIEAAQKRGYPDGSRILLPALAPDYVRRICWNVSSLLTDQDFVQHGVSIDGQGKKSG